MYWGAEELEYGERTFYRLSFYDSMTHTQAYLICYVLVSVTDVSGNRKSKFEAALQISRERVYIGGRIARAG